MQYRNNNKENIKLREQSKKMKNISRNRVLHFSTKRFQNTFQKLVNVHIVEKFIRTSLYFKVYNTSRNKFWYLVM
jgi:hypothetical protein